MVLNGLAALSPVLQRDGKPDRQQRRSTRPSNLKSGCLKLHPRRDVVTRMRIICGKAVNWVQLVLDEAG